MSEVGTGVGWGGGKKLLKNQAYIFVGKFSNYIFVENNSPVSGLLMILGLKIIKEF